MSTLVAFLGGFIAATFLITTWALCRSAGQADDVTDSWKARR